MNNNGIDKEHADAKQSSMKLFGRAHIKLSLMELRRLAKDIFIFLNNIEQIGLDIDDFDSSSVWIDNLYDLPPEKCKKFNAMMSWIFDDIEFAYRNMSALNKYGIDLGVFDRQRRRNPSVGYDDENLEAEARQGVLF